MRQTPWSRIREQNSVDKEFPEIAGNGKPVGDRAGRPVGQRMEQREAERKTWRPPIVDFSDKCPETTGPALHKRTLGSQKTATSLDIKLCKQIHQPHVIFERVQLLTLCLHSLAQCTHATRVPQGSRLSCVRKIGHSSMRHVSSPCDSQHKFTLTPPLLCSCRPLLRTQTCCPRIHISTVKIHGGMVLLRKSTPPQTRKKAHRQRWNT